MLRKNQSHGFTLIELVMVLVLLGILAAVVVPKYFNLQGRAIQRAADLIVAEAQTQLNHAFAEAIMQGQSCADATKMAVTSVEQMNTPPSNPDIKNWGFGTYILDGKTEALSLTFDFRGKKGLKGVLVLPKCSQPNP